MPSEYDPSLPTETTAIAAPVATTAAPSATTGEGYDKALGSERAARKLQEKEIATLKALISDKERQLEQTNQTLEQRYAAELEASKQSYQQQVDAAIAERDAQLQAEREARLKAEQTIEIKDIRDAKRAITGDFASTFSPLLNRPTPERIHSYMNLIADDLTTDNRGQPALIVARDANGYPTELGPIAAAIGYFQDKFPEDFKAPEVQKTGGGARNLATPSGVSSQRQVPVKFDSLAHINANPQAFLKNMDAIVAGDFQLGDR